MKKVIYIFLAMCIVFSLAGCAGGDNKPSSRDESVKSSEAQTAEDVSDKNEQPSDANDNKQDGRLAAMCAEAKDKLAFTVELEDQGNAPLYSYSMDAVASDAAGWCAMAGTQQIAVFKINDGMIDDAKARAKAYIDYLIDGYSSYGPQEVPRLKKAIIKNYSDVLVVCVCDDKNAEKILDETFD